MKKLLFGLIFAGLGAAFVAAGDAAVFDDIGFSADGKTYLFGQYGKTDVNYKPWAEIYTVDVAKNDFVPGGIYKNSSESSNSEISGKKAYSDLKDKVEWKISKYAASPAGTDTLLYLYEENEKSATDTISFKDFENSTEDKSIFYEVTLVPSYEGKGKNVRSRFYINLVKKDAAGSVVGTWKVGTPDFKRNGITSYRIEKIFGDKSGKSLVFVVQKTLEDDTGTSIRYMVETVRF